MRKEKKEKEMLPPLPEAIMTGMNSYYEFCHHFYILLSRPQSAQALTSRKKKRTALILKDGKTAFLESYFLLAHFGLFWRNSLSLHGIVSYREI